LQAKNGALHLLTDSFEQPLPPHLAASLEQKSLKKLLLGIRPEFVSIDPAGAIAGRVTLTELLGSRTLIYVDSAGAEIRVLVQGDSAIREGDPIRLSLQLPKAFYFDSDGINLLNR
jgi:ABC-type sugar transport system ATPase subunit